MMHNTCDEKRVCSDTKFALRELGIVYIPFVGLRDLAGRVVQLERSVGGKEEVRQVDN